ncbi:type II toxin-antitoxin system YafQ family toxin [Patescibacteria group bacterium]|nr:type II toxin-antitoxin system YafQ family toxin [Patescibacteria group bacterium]MBU1682886.1 type II toxin-antitoxin system YafQ family toxin [Patescibacteria group bacterium]
MFRKQLKKVDRQGKSDKVKNIIYNLANGIQLAGRFKVHKLKGKYKGIYELHIEPDLLLIYEYDDNCMDLHLIQIGSHSELFE